jgi:hypothetical protein
MKALLTLFRRAPRAHDDRLRAGRFDSQLTFSPYLAMLSMVRE